MLEARGTAPLLEESDSRHTDYSFSERNVGSTLERPRLRYRLEPKYTRGNKKLLSFVQFNVANALCGL